MNTMKYTKILALAALLTAAPAGAFAQQIGDPPEEEPAAETGEETAEPGMEEPAADEPGMEEPAAEEPAAEPSFAADPEPAAAEEVEVGADGLIYQQGGLFDLGLVVGAKVGGGFPQVFSDFDTTFAGELEIGYVLPVLDRSIEVFVSGAYAAPSDESSDAGPDPRLPGDGTWSYEATMQQLVITLGGLYRLDIGSDLVVPYGALGGRMYLWQTDVEGSSDNQDFGEYEEQDTDFGGYAALGAEFFLGPGALLIEAQFGYAAIDNFVHRDTDTGTLNAVLGYRLFL